MNYIEACIRYNKLTLVLANKPKEILFEDLNKLKYTKEEIITAYKIMYAQNVFFKRYDKKTLDKFEVPITLLDLFVDNDIAKEFELCLYITQKENKIFKFIYSKKIEESKKRYFEIIKSNTDNNIFNNGTFDDIIKFKHEVNSKFGEIENLAYNINGEMSNEFESIHCDYVKWVYNLLGIDFIYEYVLYFHPFFVFRYYYKTINEDTKQLYEKYYNFINEYDY